MAGGRPQRTSWTTTPRPACTARCRCSYSTPWTPATAPCRACTSRWPPAGTPCRRRCGRCSSARSPAACTSPAAACRRPSGGQPLRAWPPPASPAAAAASVMWRRCWRAASSRPRWPASPAARRCPGWRWGGWPCAYSRAAASRCGDGAAGGQAGERHGHSIRHRHPRGAGVRVWAGVPILACWAFLARMGCVGTPAQGATGYCGAGGSGPVRSQAPLRILCGMSFPACRSA